MENEKSYSEKNVHTHNHRKISIDKIEISSSSSSSFYLHQWLQTILLCIYDNGDVVNYYITHIIDIENTHTHIHTHSKPKNENMTILGDESRDIFYFIFFDSQKIWPRIFFKVS